MTVVFRNLPQSVCKLWPGQQLAEAPENGRRGKSPLAFGELTVGRWRVPRSAARAHAAPQRRSINVMLYEKAVESRMALPP